MVRQQWEPIVVLNDSRGVGVGGMCVETYLHLKLVGSGGGEVVVAISDEKFKRVVEGVEKRELTSWWLHLIETSVDNYLKAIHYQFDAVPFQYLDEPPKSLDLIRFNLNLVVACLQSISQALIDSPQLYSSLTSSAIVSVNDNSPNSFLTALIIPLKNTIYSKLFEYRNDVKLAIKHVLTKHFNATLPSKSDSEDELRKCFLNLKASIGTSATKEQTDLINSLTELLGDLNYINKMEQLEEQVYAKLYQKHARSNSGNGLEKEALSDIVPISGLIIGRLHRMENELKTIITHWSRSNATR